MYAVVSTHFFERLRRLILHQYNSILCVDGGYCYYARTEEGVFICTKYLINIDLKIGLHQTSSIASIIQHQCRRVLSPQDFTLDFTEETRISLANATRLTFLGQSLFKSLGYSIICPAHVGIIMLYGGVIPNFLSRFRIVY